VTELETTTERTGNSDLRNKWRWVKLSEISEVISKGTTPSTLGYSFTNAGVPFLRAEDVIGGPVRADRVAFHIDRETDAVLSRSRLKPGDLLITIAGTLGRVGYVADASPEMNCNQAVAFVRLKRDLADPEFLCLACQDKVTIAPLMEPRAGGSIQNLNLAQISSLKIPLPPLPEQKRIATILNEQMTAVEKARAATEAQLEAAKALPSAYLREVFNAPEAQKWPKKPFGNLVTNFDGKRIPVKLDDRRGRNGAYPYYGASGIIDYVNEFLFDGDYLLIGEDGANLLLRSSPIAFKATGKFWVNNHAHVVQPKDDVLMDYLIHFFTVTDLKPYVTGAAQPKLTQNDMNRITVPVPSLEQQHILTSRIFDQLSKTLRARNALDSQFDSLERLPAALLRRAFNGEL